MTTSKICSTKALLNQQTKKISSFMSWTSFPSYISKSLLHRWKSNSITHGNKNGLDDNNGNDISVIVFRLPSLHKKWSFPLRVSIRKCDQVSRKLWLWSHFVKIYLLPSVLKDNKTIFFELYLKIYTFLWNQSNYLHWKRIKWFLYDESQTD